MANFSSEAKLQLALAQLDRLLGFFPRVEGKATFILAMNVALAGSIAVNLESFALLKEFRIVVPLSANLVLSGWACILSISALFPHLKPAPHKSSLYFRDIAAVSCGEYVATSGTASADERIADALSQVWRNAEILTIKFNRTEAAFRLTLLSLPFWVWTLGFLAAGTGKIVLAS